MPRDKTESHEKIVAAAFKEFLDYGFREASMRRIASACGMSASGLYKFFSSKEGGLTFDIEKGRLSFRLTAPYSEERRRAASEQAKQNGVHKKVADLP